MDDFFSAIKDTFNERIRSPFILSFIISWLLWNWFLVFNVISFPSDYTLYEKTKFIHNYIQEHRYCNLSFKPLGYSFVITVIYILCSSVFLYVFSFYKSSIRPWIITKTSKSDTIEKHFYDTLENKYKILKDEYEKNRTINHDLEARLLDVSNRFKNISLEASESVTKQHLAESKITELEQALEASKRSEQFNERKREIFESKFMNQRTWNFYTTSKKNQHAIEELLFEKNNQVRDTTTNKLKYTIINIKFSVDNIMTHFILVNINDTSDEFAYYLTEMDSNSFKGFKVHRGDKFDVHMNQTPVNRQSR